MARFNEELVRELIGYFPLKELKDRGTGRTTALALRYLAEAIENPGIVLYPKDHWNTEVASQNLTRVMLDIVSDAGLEGFTFTRNSVVSTFAVEV